ncbi:MAG: RdgB/HAM1 family non-canonical purine NTP pyrophosphatase [Chitinophagaceae bacterium]|nr:RdgB/HAM1 family non-canonical purine NTP pyrophosphatase [Chitinophagaceae bacterium]
MRTLIFATNNQHKVDEIKMVTGSDYKIISLKEAGIDIDIPEPFNTLEENAITKAETIYELLGQDCFSEDTGLEVTALNGEPGVKSARYAGEDKSFSDNIDKVLFKLNGQKNREAVFRTVICLVLNGEKFLFEGACRGSITSERKGDGGFGYDPVFIPDGYSETFSQMDAAEKIELSHRTVAVQKLLAHLSINGNFGSI